MGDKQIRDLDDGLVLRRAEPADAESLVAFNARVHSDVDWETPDESVGAWVRDLATRPHPTFDIGDFLIVEDTLRGEIVSSSNLISQTWAYDGVPFGVGRPELVGTHPDYRRRGLVKAQFEVLHRWSAEREHQVQAITGIPWYYRQFGYEMALDLGGSRSGNVAGIPKLAEDEDEPYRVRVAASDDLGFIAEVASLGQQRSMIACLRDRALWRYALDGQSAENVQARALRVIETREGEAVGFLTHALKLWGDTLYLDHYELKPGISFWQVTPSVLRYLREAGESCEAYLPSEKDLSFERVAFGLGRQHPSYDVVVNRLPKVSDPYAWYIRVADLPGFLCTVASVLERRLADSVMVGYSGSLKLNFYRTGVEMVFEDGELVNVAPWAPQVGGDQGAARFPDLTFLQLLFGYHAFSELNDALADCFASLEGRLLLDALFPKKSSDVWPVS